MWWRVTRVKVELNPEINSEKDVVTIAVDSTGIRLIVVNGYAINGSREEALSRYTWLSM